MPWKQWVLALTFSIAPAYSQTDISTITGRVVDPTGAVIAGAQVTVIDTDTNFQNSTVTNQDGLYRVTSLHPGPYRVTVFATGFKQFIRKDLDLRAEITMAVDAAMEIGGQCLPFGSTVKTGISVEGAGQIRQAMAF
jgi:hypothetical protein